MASKRILFKNLNLSSLLFSIKALDSGFNIDILLEKPFDASYAPFVTSTFQHNKMISTEMLQKLTALDKLYALYPFWFYPMRFNFHVKRVKAHYRYRLLDLLLKNDRENSIMLAGRFKKISPLFGTQRYLSVREYCFDYQAAIAYLMNVF